MNSRQIDLVHYLIKEDCYMTTKVIAEKLQVSERTIHKDLNIVEGYIQINRLPLSIKRKKGTGIWLRGLPHEKEQLIALVNGEEGINLERQQLRELLTFHILQHKKRSISLDELADKLFVGRKIIQEELANLQSLFKQNGLEIVSKTGIGTFVVGDERDKRQLLVETLRSMQSNKIDNVLLKDFFAKETLKVIHDTLKEVLLENKISVSTGLFGIEIHIYFMLERMKQSQKIILSDDEIAVVNDTLAQRISSQVLEKLTTIYPIVFSPDEINYLALRIASLFPDSRSYLCFQKESEELASYLIEQVQELLGYSLGEDTVLKNNLMSHLSSTFFRLNYGLVISNPLTKNIFGIYTQLFLMLQLNLEDFFEQETFVIPQEEIAYLTIHFQSAIERHKSKKSRSFQAILVSEYSKAMATFIEVRLNRELPELKILDLIEYNEAITQQKLEAADFILSTVPFKHQTIPVLEVSPMITENDLLNIEKYMLAHVPNKRLKTFDLVSFTSPLLVFPQLSLQEPEAILKFMGETLVLHDYVAPQFVSKMLERDRHSSTRVAELITLPHGNPLYVKQSIIAIATLREPIEWHGERIRLVLLIAMKKEQLKNREFKKMFPMIHYLEKSPEQINDICQMQNPLEIIKKLSIYE